jgi:hypothetical protein
MNSRRTTNPAAPRALRSPAGPRLAGLVKSPCRILMYWANSALSRPIRERYAANTTTAVGWA